MSRPSSVCPGASWRNLFGLMMTLSNLPRHGTWLRVDVGTYEPITIPFRIQGLFGIPPTAVLILSLGSNFETFDGLKVSTRRYMWTRDPSKIDLFVDKIHHP